MQQEEIALNLQSKAVQDATDECMAAEKEFFNADRFLLKLAENLEDVTQSKAIIDKLDKEK